MSTLLIILGSIVAYLTIGRLSARATTPMRWRRSLATNAQYNTLQRRFAERDVRATSWLFVLLWPVMFIIYGIAEALGGSINQDIEKHNPARVEQERQIREQEAIEMQMHIRRLERELLDPPSSAPTLTPRGYPVIRTIVDEHGEKTEVKAW